MKWLFVQMFSYYSSFFEEFFEVFLTDLNSS